MSGPWLLRRGNAKVGAGVWTYSHTPVDGCGGCATADCAEFCYAVDLMRRPSLAAAWASRLMLARESPKAFGQLLAGDLARLPPGAVVRVHVAGDFFSAAYAQVWLAAMRAYPQVTFYGYTRGWRVPEIRRVLDRMRRLANVTLWASTDRLTGRAPRGWHEARYVDDVKALVGIWCPEQAGRQPDCGTCRMCWRVRRDRPVTLSFLDHGALRVRRRLEVR